MNYIIKFAAISTALSFAACSSAGDQIDRKVAELMAKMTIEEKIG